MSRPLRHPPADTARRETRPLLVLALPICGAQLAQAGMSVADVMMTGRLSATDLAAVSVGSSLWLPLMLFMTGTLMGLTPIVAQLLGGRRGGEIGPNVHQGLWVALALGALAALMLWYAVGPIFTLMEVPEAVAERSTQLPLRGRPSACPEPPSSRPCAPSPTA